MPEYRRLIIPGGTYFFTVNLADRRSGLFVKHIDALRTRLEEAGKTFNVAIIAVARIMLTQLNAIIRDGRDYVPG